MPEEVEEILKENDMTQHKVLTQFIKESIEGKRELLSQVHELRFEIKEELLLAN